MADGKKQRVKLADGRKVRLTAPQVQLYELCKRVENLPREIIEKVLEDLPWSILQSLKYSRGLHDIAFDLVHQRVYLDSEDALEDNRDKLVSLGSAIRNLIYYGGSPDYALLIDFLIPEQLPSLRTFRLRISHDAPSITIDNARMLVEQIHDGGRDDAAVSKTAKKAIKALKECRVLYEEDRASLFPSLRELNLSNASPALAACILSRQCTLSQLKRLQLVHLRSDVRVKDFPCNLTALDITGCDFIGFNDLLQLARRSQNTLEYLLYHDQGQQPLLNYVGNPVIECPRLRYLAIHDACFCEDHREAARSDDDKAIQTPDWTRKANGFISRIRAPELRSLGLGYTLFDATLDELGQIMISRKETKLEAVLCRHPEPHLPEDLELDGPNAAPSLQRNFAAALFLCNELGLDLMCLEPEDYDGYCEDAFAGNYWWGN